MENCILTRPLAWPADLERQSDGSVLVSFPDIPEALTEGETENEALSLAGDCLIAALGEYIGARRNIPKASSAQGSESIALPALTAAKVALYVAMRSQEISNTALAARLGVTEGAVRRLIDLDHRSHIGHVEKALHCLGQQLTVSIEAA